MDIKDRSIAWQNATNAAATVYSQTLTATGEPFDINEFDAIRESIYLGSEDRIEGFGAAAVAEAFPGTVSVAPAPAAAPVVHLPTPSAQFQAAAAGPGPAPFPGAAPAATGGDEAAWQDLFANYGGWYDNRADKASGKGPAKGPDFKRKSDKKALWINSKSTPAWVNEKLAQG